MDSADAGLKRDSAGQGFSQLFSSGLSLKLIFSAAGALLMLGIVVLSVTQCADEENEPSTASSAAGVARELITKDVPDAYLVKPGVVEVDK